MRKAREIREARGMSLEDVVRQTTIGAGHLAKFERGIAGLSLEKAGELATFYGVTLDDLVAEVPADASAARQAAADGE